eukprot:5356_1
MGIMCTYLFPYLWLFTMLKKTLGTAKVFQPSFGFILSSCAITNDLLFIYTFGETDSQETDDFALYKHQNVIRYDIEKGVYQILNVRTACNRIARAITAGNDKIYLHGCSIASWKTTVFNPQTERFETETVDIATPQSEFLPYYGTGRLARFEDNVILMVQTVDTSKPIKYTRPVIDEVLLYYGITEEIAINFTDTVPLFAIWPSDGLDIKYYVNDFAGNNREYDVRWCGDDTAHVINHTVTLNTMNDGCICNQSSYKCFNCSQHLNLSHHLSTKDNHIYELKLTPKFDGFYANDPLFRPESLIIELQRCVIEFDNIFNETTTSKNPSIWFRFELSQNCYLRTNEMYTLDIAAPKVNISNQLSISILNNNTFSCQICDARAPSECFDCENTFMLKHETHDLDDTKFNVTISSNSIDFEAIPTQRSIQYINKQWKEKAFEWTEPVIAGISAVGFIVMLLICGGIGGVLYCRKQYQTAFVVDNALVLIIGIAQYDVKKQFLPGVAQNIIDLQRLWGDCYQYDVFVLNAESLYSTAFNVENFVDETITELENKDKRYKAVIVHVISHGSDSYFTTSDMQNMKRDFITHELTTKAEDVQNLELIKVIFYHTCMGDVDYHSGEPLKTGIVRGSFIIPNSSTIEYNDETISYESNLVTVSGNIKGRSVSDKGDFTKCVCVVFRNNEKRWIKSDFDTLLKEIKLNLEKETQHAELCHPEGIISYSSVRFEKCCDKKALSTINIELQMYASKRDYKLVPQKDTNAIMETMQHENDHSHSNKYLESSPLTLHDR